jgi:hypothetical protein
LAGEVSLCPIALSVVFDSAVAGVAGFGGTTAGPDLVAFAALFLARPTALR